MKNVGMPRIEDDPEPKYRDPEDPTDAELEAHAAWTHRHWDAIEPSMRAEPDLDDEDIEELIRLRPDLARHWRRP
jgi:hypothetical protein